MSKKRDAWFVILGALLLVACGSGRPSEGLPGANDYDFGPILQSTVGDVILPTYKGLLDNAALLVGKVAKIDTDGDLKAAQAQWVIARKYWEQSEAFLFGPVSDLGLDPAIDSWPVDRAQLDEVLASNLELTPETLQGNLGGGLKGFHTIEYLLFGVGGKKTAAELKGAPRELEYLAAAAEALRLDAETLYLAWAPEGDKFGESFYLSGQTGGRYFSQVDAVQQLVNGCADIADEVANGKIADPYKEKNPELVESQFSYNSLQDFSDNLQSAQNIYGGMNGGLGVSTYVAGVNPELDARVKTEIQAAIDAILAISPDNDPPFRDAITDPSLAGAIEAAQKSIRTVMTSMQGDVMATLFN